MTKRGKPPPANDTDVFDADTKRAQKRIARTRDKISKALENPEMRQQMVEAIRRMMMRRDE